MADPGTPDWWLSRLYDKLIARQRKIRLWDDWYVGHHPVPNDMNDPEVHKLAMRLLETVGLNMMKVVTDAALDRMQVTGFQIGGAVATEVWDIWQANNFDLGSEQVRQEKMALSEAYVMVAPDATLGARMTPEHPEQCIVEMAAGDRTARSAGLKVWRDDTGPKPLVYAWLTLPDAVYTYAAPTRMYADGRQDFALKPAWELQEQGTGSNPLGEVALVPFPNGGRMIADPLPEFHPAIPIQYRINKTILDRMAMQDRGAFKAMWATGIKIPRDPATGKPIEDFIKSLDRMFINENPAGRFGQFEAEDIKQMLEATREDIADCAIAVPTSPDQVMAKLVNVSGDGLKLAQVSEVKRVRRHIRHESEPWEVVGRLSLKAAGKSVPNVERMSTTWRNPEYRTDTEAANAATVAIAAGMPREVAWERYFGISPDDVGDWREKLRAEQTDVVTEAIVAGLNRGNDDNAA